MALDFEGKKAIVAEVNGAAQAALSVVVADACGVTVDAMTALRKKGREAGVQMRIIRNTLAKRAFSGTQYECLNDTFVGPTLFAFSMEHPGAGARLFKEFAKEEDAFQIKAAAYEQELISAQNIDRLASLPTKDEAIARFMLVVREASAGKLVRTLAALRDKLQAA